jgi:Arc/MetJ family transcription regulator
MDELRFSAYWNSLVYYQSVMSRSNIDLHFAVAACVMVVYDLGEQDVVLKLLPFLCYLQC